MNLLEKLKPKKKADNKKADTAEASDKLKKSTRRIILVIVWLGAFSPFFAIIFGLWLANDSIPSHEELANPPDKQASIIYSADGVEMGRFWSVNRKSVDYNKISPYVVSALISTEDERYYEHAGVDFYGIARAIGKAAMGKDGGGASTISQQLAKLLYTVTDTVNGGVAKSKKDRLIQKFGENILAVRLERAYTKEEILTMYLNNFDFLYNAVGISSAAQVYFNKAPIDLKMEEAAMLVGMCKNPGLYNPLKFQLRSRYDAGPEGQSAYEKDSANAYNRRNTVLDLWCRNSSEGNEYLSSTITQAQCDSLKKLPIVVDYQKVDHKEGLAPHFREVLRKELTSRLNEQDEDGNYIIAKQDGTPYNIYKDGLRIYTTIDSRMQAHAEYAVQEHMSTTLQIEFDKNNNRNKRPPFGNEVTEERIDQIMNSAIKNSDRYREMSAAGHSEASIEKAFNTPTEMKVFSYWGDFDTIMTPYDSIKYYKSQLQAGLMSMDPKTGFVKAWVGGPDFNHFAYDHVKQSKRQVGSTIKPFVYAAAIYLGLIDPCSAFADVDYCIDVPKSPTRMESWCPATGTKNTGDLIPAKCGLAGSLNNITVAVMKEMGPQAGPQTMSILLKNVGINLKPEEVVAAMCLGPMDVSLYDMVGAQSTFANKGLFIKPIYIMRVEDRNGNVLIDLEYEMHEAMPEVLAFTMLEMMKGAVNGASNVHQGGQVYATSSSLRSSRPWGGLKYSIAGKTGTTNGASDGWFMGLTPDLVTGVWVGADDRDIHFRSYPWGQGARMALPIWGYYMQKVYGDSRLDISKGDFEAPPIIEYDPTIFNCSKSQGIDPLF
ncbi:transglycosylase domain-containing protein [Paracrocinitomix mangrovi]|uniref:transglycosylase domain-containing protein n=1 Tax=Paracrocinitomix mangrovi TaxID=2862509 RepID=UPI001C8ECAC9|nr:transglycosylase domain-containing protein [Paracrocinitomix mangrovi]UKN03637.1 transglycosylase domain-containing protein [Paracrocinitomix mangrovi]